MAFQTKNPVPLAKATGLRNVSCWAASDLRVNSASLHEIQERFVIRRTRLSPSLAHVVVELAFGRAA